MSPRTPARLALLLLATFIARSVLAGPCEDALENAIHSSPGTQLTTATEMVQCFNSTKMSFNTVYFTLTNLLLTFKNYYAFTSIANNTKASTQSVKCGLETHNINIDMLAELYALLDKYTAWSTEFMTVEDGSMHEVVKTLNQLVIPGAFGFHMEIRKLFNRLFDSHTQYNFWCPPPQGYETVLPIQGKLEMHSGQLTLFVKGYPFTSPDLEPFTLPNMDTWRAVSSIMAGGKEFQPVDWLTNLANNVGSYKDRGQRLNSLYQAWNVFEGENYLSLTVWQYGVDHVSDDVTFTFADGAEPKSHIIRWLASWDANTSTEALSNLCEAPNPNFQSAIEMDLQLNDKTEALAKECLEMDSCKTLLNMSRRLGTGGTLTNAHVNTLGTAFKAVKAAFPHLTSEQAEEVGRMSLQDMLKRPIVESFEHTKQLSSRSHQDLLRRQITEKLRKKDDMLHPRSLSEINSFSWDVDNMQQCLAHGTPPDHTVPTAVFSAGFADGGASGVAVYQMGDTMIYKLSGFGGAMQDWVLGVMAYVRMTQHARKEGISRVLIDIISNGGGLVYFCNFMVSLFTHNYDKRSACADYTKRLDQTTLWYVDAYGKDGLQLLLKPDPQTGYPRGFDILLNADLETAKLLVSDALSRLQIYLTGAKKLGLQVSDEQLSKVTHLQAQIQNATSVTHILDTYYDYLQTKAFVPAELIQVQDTMTGQFKDMEGWLPFAGNELIDRETLKNFKDMEHFSDPTEQQWGAGSKSMYTKKGLLGCELATVENLIMLFLQLGPSFLKEDPNFQKLISELPANDGTAKDEGLRKYFTDVTDFLWEDIAVLTDGLSGSAGSLFPTKLFASGKATLYGYGGVPGELMDTSAYAGGNVLEWPAYWKQAFIAGYYALFMDDKNKWAQWANSNSEFPVPTAMSTAAANVRFNYNMMFIPEMSEETTLPREFYIYPASKRLNKWKALATLPCVHTSDLLELYADVLADDWCAVRSNPPTASLGGWTCASKSICGSCKEIKKVYKDNACCGMPDKKIGSSFTCRMMKADFKKQRCCPR